LGQDSQQVFGQGFAPGDPPAESTLTHTRIKLPGRRASASRCARIAEHTVANVGSWSPCSRYQFNSWSWLDAEY
jgi:hypothetical protein